MRSEGLPKQNEQMSVVTGTGLIALDVIIRNGTKPNYQLNAGGSCGNILTILSYLGCKSYPIAHIGSDNASKLVIQDMTNFGVNTSLILQDENRKTPIFVETIRTAKNGRPIHKFMRICPDCGSYLPRFRGISKNILETMRTLPKSNIFYFDRITYGSMELAKKFKNTGSLIFFEPNGIKNWKHFFECSALADVVKFSHEMLGKSEYIWEKLETPLIIETLGSEGLRFRFDNKNNTTIWKDMPAYDIKGLRDAAGAGDWCSAGIIHTLCRNDAINLKDCREKDIEMAIKYGQALAAVNCHFEGARGAMYNISRENLSAIISSIMDKKEYTNKYIEMPDESHGKMTAHSMITQHLDAFEP